MVSKVAKWVEWLVWWRSGGHEQHSEAKFNPRFVGLADAVGKGRWRNTLARGESVEACRSPTIERNAIRTDTQMTGAEPMSNVDTELEMNCDTELDAGRTREGSA